MHFQFPKGQLMKWINFRLPWHLWLARILYAITGLSLLGEAWQSSLLWGLPALYLLWLAIRPGRCSPLGCTSCGQGAKCDSRQKKDPEDS